MPENWKIATIVPIAKPDKPREDPNNYRPISLTSCLCKTFEKMVNRRLIEYLENNKILAETHCGFRKYRSTIDHLVRFVTYIRKALARGERGVMTSEKICIQRELEEGWQAILQSL